MKDTCLEIYLSQFGRYFSTCLVAYGRSIFRQPGEPSLPIVDKYVDATHAQQEAMRGAQMEVDIDAKLPSLEKHGQTAGAAQDLASGADHLQGLGFSGDNTVKQEVITRYLAAESEAPRERHDRHHAGQLQIQATRADGVRMAADVDVLQITPRKKKGGPVQGRTVAGCRNRHAGARIRPVREDSLGIS